MSLYSNDVQIEIYQVMPRTLSILQATMRLILLSSTTRTHFPARLGSTADINIGVTKGVSVARKKLIYRRGGIYRGIDGEEGTGIGIM